MGSSAPSGTTSDSDAVLGNTPAIGISGFFEVKVYRDSANASALFAGADPYTVAAQLKEADVHYQKDSLGSWSELNKWG